MQHQQTSVLTTLNNVSKGKFLPNTWQQLVKKKIEHKVRDFGTL